MKSIRCILGFHKWNPLAYKAFYYHSKSSDPHNMNSEKRLVKEYCIRCGKIRNLVEFDGEVYYK